MGCGPSRPSRSFYGEYIVDNNSDNRKRAQQQQEQRPKKSGISRPELKPPVQNTKKVKRPVTIAEAKYAEAVAKRDLRIYEEEMRMRKKELDTRTFVRHMAMRGDEVVF